MSKPKQYLKRTRRLVLAALLFGFIFAFLVPEPVTIPVHGASSADWHQDTFWYEPWGSSGVHKGVDIFANKGTDVVAASHHLVIYRGQWPKGGNVIIALGPKWRLHYYAHLDSFSDSERRWFSGGEQIGSVGTSGNAQGKAAHLHYSLVTLIPYFWLIDSAPQGVKKAFYLNPITYFDN